MAGQYECVEVNDFSESGFAGLLRKKRFGQVSDIKNIATNPDVEKDIPKKRKEIDKDDSRIAERYVLRFLQAGRIPSRMYDFYEMRPLTDAQSNLLTTLRAEQQRAKADEDEVVAATEAFAYDQLARGGGDAGDVGDAPRAEGDDGEDDKCDGPGYESDSAAPLKDEEGSRPCA